MAARLTRALSSLVNCRYCPAGRTAGHQESLSRTEATAAAGMTTPVAPPRPHHRTARPSQGSTPARRRSVLAAGSETSLRLVFESATDLHNKHQHDCCCLLFPRGFRAANSCAEALADQDPPAEAPDAGAFQASAGVGSGRCHIIRRGYESAS